MTFTKPGTTKTVTVTNKGAVAVLEAAGWVQEKPAEKPRTPRTKKNDD